MRVSGNSLAPYLNQANQPGSRYTADTIIPSRYWPDPLMRVVMIRGAAR